MALNTAELLAKVRQRKSQLKSWEWWDTSLGRSVFHLNNHNERDLDSSSTLYLTPAERKRQRKLNRIAEEEDQRKKIKLGIEKAPAPKLKVKNVHSVFGAAYYKDPTKYELMAKEAEDQRRQLHIEQNQARAKSPEQKWEKHIEKVRADREAALHCVAFKTAALDSKHQYIVDYTAKKYELTGALLLGEKDAYLIVEGGGPEILKVEKLMSKKFQSQLLWRGELPQANFSRWSIHSTPDRESFLKTYGVNSIFDTV